MQTDPLHVVIIGAGCGGLALAHALRRASVSCAVYEAQRSHAGGPDGHRVGLDLLGHQALEKCLPPELSAAFRAACARFPRYVTVLTEEKEVTVAFPLRRTAEEVVSEHSVSRQTLRRLLLAGLEDRVHFGKEFTRYERQADGTVTALFADGTSASGQVLVAADGAHSAVRAQYLPQTVRQPHAIVTIGAKVPLNRAALSLLPAQSRQGLSLVVAPGGLTCVWQVMESGRGQGPRRGARPDVAREDAVPRAWPVPLPGNARGHIAWGLWAPQDHFPAGVSRLRGRELVELVLRLTPRWHQDFRTLFSMADPATLWPLRIATSEPVPAWRPSNITLIGDAGHPMTTGQRVGANTALRDAMLLSQALAAVQAGHVRLLNAIAAYEAEAAQAARRAYFPAAGQGRADLVR